MSIAVQCTKCQTTFRVKEAYAGKRGACPACKGTVQVPAAGRAAPTAPEAKKTASPAAASVSPTTLTFACPSCQRTMRCASSHAGKKAKCGNCQQAITVPMAGAAPAPSSLKPKAPKPAPSVKPPAHDDSLAAFFSEELTAAPARAASPATLKPLPPAPKVEAPKPAKRKGPRFSFPSISISLPTIGGSGGGMLFFLWICFRIWASYYRVARGLGGPDDIEDPTQEWRQMAYVVATAPSIAPNAVFAPTYHSVGGQEHAGGLAFAVKAPQHSAPLIVGLARHSWPEVPDLERITTRDLRAQVDYVDLLEAFTRAGPLAVRNGLLADDSQGMQQLLDAGLAAAWAPPNAEINALPIADRPPARGEVVWLVAPVTGGAEVGQPLHQAAIISTSDEDDEAFLLCCFKAAGLDLRSLGGAPFVNAEGKVVGVLDVDNDVEFSLEVDMTLGAIIDLTTLAGALDAAAKESPRQAP